MARWLDRLRRRGPVPAPPLPAPRPAARPPGCDRCGRHPTTTVTAMESKGFVLCPLCRREWIDPTEPARPEDGA